MNRINTEARKACACSKCGAKPTEPCRYPSGREYGKPHVERLLAYHRSISPEEFERRHKIVLAR